MSEMFFQCFSDHKFNRGSNVAELLQRDPGFNNYGFNRGLKQRYMSDFRFSNYGFDRGAQTET